MAAWLSVLKCKAIRGRAFSRLAVLGTDLHLSIEAWNDGKHACTLLGAPDRINVKAKHRAIPVRKD